MKCISYFIIAMSVLLSQFAIASNSKGNIKIGYIGGLTGPDVGQSAQFAVEAIRMVFDEVNRHGGIHGKKLELITIDNQGVPQENLSAFEKAKTAGVTVITGVHFSNDGLLLADLAEKSQIPLVVISATHPDIVRGRSFVVRMCFNDEAQGDTLSKFTLSVLKPKKVFVITDIRNSFSLYLSKRYIHNLETDPTVSVAELKVSKGDTDFEKTINVIMQPPLPSLIFFTTQARESATIIKEITSRGLKADLLGTDAWTQVDIIKILHTLGQSSRVYFSSHGMPELSDPKWKKLSKRISQVSHQSLSPYLCDPTLAVDTAFQIVDALKNAKSLTPTDVMVALKASKIKGLMGPSSFLPNGESEKKPQIMRVLNENVEAVSF